MPHREAIQRFAMKPPSGHEAVHQGDEAGVVGGFQQVGHFMRHDVFEALPRFPGQIGWPGIAALVDSYRKSYQPALSFGWPGIAALVDSYKSCLPPESCFGWPGIAALVDSLCCRNKRSGGFGWPGIAALVDSKPL